MKVLSLAWKYDPSITSGVGVACEGLNKALSQLVELTVIYPKISTIQVTKEVLLSTKDLNPEQRAQIANEYYHIVDEGLIELAIRFDPYFVSHRENEVRSSRMQNKTNPSDDVLASKKIKVKQEWEELLYNDVDVFGESVKDKIFLYNRLVEELAEGIQFDIIHAHDWMTFPAGIAVSAVTGRPLIVHVHATEFDRSGEQNAQSHLQLLLPVVYLFPLYLSSFFQPVNFRSIFGTHYSSRATCSSFRWVCSSGS